MKKNLLLLIPALALVFFVASCSKDDDNTTPASNTIGKWTGTYTQNGSGPSFFSLNFKNGGLVEVQANNASNPDLGNGFYTVIGDSVKGSFIYNVGIGVNYLFAGKYTVNNSVITGTIGISPSYNDNATFIITKP